MTIGNKKIPNYYIYITIGVVIAGVAAILFLVLRGSEVTPSPPEAGRGFFGFLFGEDASPQTPSSLQENGAAQNGAEQKKYLFRISDEPVAGATVAPDGTHVRYFKKSTGHLFENKFTGHEEKRVSNITIPAVQNAQWTPSKEYAIISFYDEGEIRRLYSRYSGTSTVTSAFLPKDIKEIAVSQTADRIAYTISSGGETSLFTAQPDNTGIKNIFSTPISDFEITWPAANLLGLKTKSSAYAPSFLYTINASGGAFTRLFAEKQGFDVLWAPDGKTLLAMETTNEGTSVSLQVISLADNAAITLPFVTLPEKCAWAPTSEQRVLYCGVPQSVPRGANLPDAWWQGSVSFEDTLWRIAVDTGERQQLLPAHQLDAVNLFVAENEEFLFFTNKKDGLLWSIHLKS